jgi:hypothetical protein
VNETVSRRILSHVYGVVAFEASQLFLDPCRAANIRSLIRLESVRDGITSSLMIDKSSRSLAELDHIPCGINWQAE